MKPTPLELKLHEMELKHGKEAFYELPDNHPDIKEMRRLSRAGQPVTTAKIQTWLNENGEELKELCKVKTVSELGNYYELSNSSVKIRLEKLGLEALPKTKKKKESNWKKIWDDKAIAYFVENYRDMNAYDLAKKLNISVSSVYNKASKLKLSKKKGVIMRDLEGNEVRRFDDAKQAEEELVLRAASVREACSSGKRYFKHYWEYI